MQLESGDKTQEGPPKTSPPARKGGAGLHSALRRLLIRFRKHFRRERGRDSLEQLRGQRTTTRIQLRRTRPPSSGGKATWPFRSASGPRTHLLPFCPAASSLPTSALWLLSAGRVSSPSYTDEDPETLKGSNLPEATQLPVAELRWDPETLEESKAKSTP